MLNKDFRRFAIPAMATLTGVSQTPVDPANLADRDGYDPGFLGAQYPIALPRLTAIQRTDSVRLIGTRKTELKYEHFSVIQSKSRRLCYFSACNLDGEKSRKVPRSNSWRYDGRIPLRYQILEECYGPSTADMFSRGHMSRREDPVWGTMASARLAERDTFIVTNAVPQMQSHNSPVWLGLEDYLLKNSRKDRQRVSVFTGPVFRKSDPVLYGVKIPITFWKIVAFLHDETGELAAAGYRDRQAEFVPDAEAAFVFGSFQEMQVTIRAIAKMTGLSFGVLAKADVLADADVGFALAVKKPSDSILR